MNNVKFLTINGKKIPIEGEKNLLEICRKAEIEIPTFCYHSELSVYGACRLCLVDVKGRGIVASCSTSPEEGMEIKTHTREIREMRKISIELLLANENHNCPSCSKNESCKLRHLAAKLGVEEVRFKPASPKLPIDTSSDSLIRDPNKCILCGDCVRYCAEIQGIGAIDFTGRGSNACVMPAFGRDLAQVECVNCGQCAAVCPTGAIVPKPETDGVWKALEDENSFVAAQIAPAVRVAIGEMFGMKPGESLTGKIVNALKMMGFDAVYDTSFAADLTVIEEGSEFLARKALGEGLPMFTSCCPAWVKYAEQYYPELLSHLSSCRSPQQMFGSVAKKKIPAEKGIEAKNLVVVSIMPCTAKKFEAKRPEFSKDGVRDVDFVITTQELGRMIKEAGIVFNELSPESLDLPLGFHTGAGLIFGNSGGVSEAVLRYAAEKASGMKKSDTDYYEVRGEQGIREAEIAINGSKLKLAVVHGLKNAHDVIEKVRRGESEYDLIEVMACPGGCVGGAGQPVSVERDVRRKRTKGLFDGDKLLPMHKSQDNPFITKCYEEVIGDINGETAHHLLHTDYKNRKRITGGEIELLNAEGAEKTKVKVCVGTGCYLKGSQSLLHSLIRYAESGKLKGKVDVSATFCLENCGHSPNVSIDGEVIGDATFEKVTSALNEKLLNPALF